MLELCLFDLDNTLVKTDDLKELREACKNNADAARLRALNGLLRLDPNRRVYSLQFLRSIEARFPDLKLGVFTRSPRSYTEAVLAWAYPNFEWDIVISYEDLGARTKPYGDGMVMAMDAFNIERIERVVLIGDTDVDVKAAYNAGCLVAIDKRAWPYPHQNEHWRALDLIPDAVIAREDEVLEFLGDNRPFLPDLERLLEEGELNQGLRYVKVGYFVPREVEADRRRYAISLAGRSFANYPVVELRKEDSRLSASIEENKESEEFPDAWIQTLRNFIGDTFEALFRARDVIVTVVPHRPGRDPRLEMLLSQLAESVQEDPIEVNVDCVPDLLAYTDGVRSNHNERLGRIERFENVRDHLVVNRPQVAARNASILVIDDVVTTGASLIYAQKRLEAAGATDVRLFGLGKNIGDIYAFP